MRCRPADALLSDNLTLHRGRGEVLKRFIMLSRLTESVTVRYLPPVELGATTVAPGPLDHLGHQKPNRTIEVQNSQEVVFGRTGRAAALRWWLPLLPQRLTVQVLTRLTMDREGTRIRRHEDEWLDTRISLKPGLGLKRALGKALSARISTGAASEVAAKQ